MLEFDGTGVVFAAIGAATLVAAVLPRGLRRLPLSMPMFFVAAGMIAFGLIGKLPDPDPMVHQSVALHLTEVCVIVSLMGAGLALNRPPGLRRWGTTWRLLGLTMPLSMLAVGFHGWWALGLGGRSVRPPRGRARPDGPGARDRGAGEQARRGA